MKKTFSILAASAALFLTVTPFAHAGTPAKKHVAKKTAKATTVDYNTVVIRDTDPKTQTVGTEVGNDAPHEERNPSQHPELFQYNR